VLLIIAVAFLVYFFKNRNKVNALTEEYSKEKQGLIEKYESDQEEERLSHKKEVSTLNEKYHNDTTLLNNKLSSLRQFTVDKGDDLKGLTLRQLNEHLVRNEKLRETDMYILSNVYLPARNYTNKRKIDHLGLGRPGIYIID